jgi:excisionase family DNA binding protein
MSIISIGGLGHDPGAQHVLDFDDVHSVAEACRLLRCSRASVYRMIALGQLRRAKVLNRTLILGARAHIARQLPAEG